MTDTKIIAKILVKELIAFIDGDKSSPEANKVVDIVQLPSIHCNAKGVDND